MTEALTQSLRSALAFAASHSCITSAQEQAILRAAIPALEAAMQPGEGEVKRVARAICDDLTGTQGTYPIDEADLRTARAAIAAMKG